MLENAGFLTGLGESVAGSDETEPSRPLMTGPSLERSVGEGRGVGGTPWFEEMIEGSELGRIRRRGRTSDGRVTVEYEITEFENEDEGGGTSTSAKRKLGSLRREDDVEMRSG